MTRAAVALEVPEQVPTMKVLRLDATWQPRPHYAVSPEEERTRRARVASAVWKDPQLAFEDVSIPEIEDAQVLLRVRACGVCGSDTHCIETDEDRYVLFSGMARLPVTLGHEFSGTVVETGKSVRNLRVGDAVAAESCLWCGVCTSCRSGHPNQCENMDLLGFSAPGAFAEYVAVAERHCWEIDSLQEAYGEDQMYEAGALIEPLGCAYNGIFVDGGGFLPGATVAVFGAGPIGLAAVMLAKIGGAAKVFAFDRVQGRVDLALVAGADHAASLPVLESQGLTPSEVLMDLTHGRGVNLLIEAAGAASETIPEMQRCFAPNGKLVFLGRSDTRSTLDFNPIVSGANVIVGSRGHAGSGTYSNVIRLLASGRLQPRSIITSRYSFGEAQEALRQSTSRLDGKIMVLFP